jgi:ubiquinone/menaquinone biosynthesis C-methylase UbiE
MTVKRVPLTEEPITGPGTVSEYDEYAGTYMVPEYRYFVRKILRRGVRGGRVLDFGTGTGRLAIELAKARNCNFEIIGLDISPDMLRKADENAQKAGIEKKVDFILATAERLPFPDQSFDLIISYASLHHWLHPVAVFNEAQRIIKPSGVIIIRDNRRVYGNPVWEALIWACTRFMNQRQRKLWPKSILASYTIQEIRKIVKGSNLSFNRVYTDFVQFDVCIETDKR